MEMQGDFSVVSVFYFLASAAILLAVKFHFPQRFFIERLARFLRAGKLISGQRG